MAVKIRFWWPGYTPTEVLESFSQEVLGIPFEVRSGSASWRPATGTLGDVRDWMGNNDLDIVKTELVGQRRVGRWEGRYVLTID